MILKRHHQTQRICHALTKCLFKPTIWGVLCRDLEPTCHQHSASSVSGIHFVDLSALFFEFCAELWQVCMNTGYVYMCFMCVPSPPCFVSFQGGKHLCVYSTPRRITCTQRMNGDDMTSKLMLHMLLLRVLVGCLRRNWLG